ncbi:hypothetical protein GDO81_023724 [Engystomops pustulosus]|uniref:Uncharacterized protein n=1 Tax=Engystomops pustulosus TaxID=76066 RepID=A0AAV6ZHF5_ENGPU|nr:hypothetical protein GDO81_023724 [Engystomops pustulosus]
MSSLHVITIMKDSPGIKPESAIAPLHCSNGGVKWTSRIP